MSTPMSLPQLIAAGDDDAIAGFRDAHIEKVRAYCAVACPPGRVDEACDAAFVDFLGRVVGNPDGDTPLEDVLLKATRSAAAPRFRSSDAAAETRPGPCAATPELLAARANGELRADSALTSHLKHCVGCQGSAATLEQADAAFRACSGWETPTGADPAPESSAAVPEPPAVTEPLPPRTVTVRARRGGVVGAVKRLGKQRGGGR